ncbi:hypothetical protein PQU92_10395 [Asticcacaulis sp. BYS171W]|uniref:Uncharacterized protein n=1 Tax=Asticcacaulis aquaticus TaxID=2984212 RepID=A0ABT5HUH0_9CAUL|nr:hypothetical protein [Asticcacaulis aquaticus]MDC7683689.1 hypothetical protein [Asticcacaulis aquaticus]
MLKILTTVTLAGLACLLPSALWAQSAPPEGGTPAVVATETPAPDPKPEGPKLEAPKPESITIPNGTPIVVVITELVSTRTAKVGDMFALKLAEPLLWNGTVVIPEGTPGKGEVIDTGKPGMGGKPGKLVLAARYLEFEGRQVPIRALKMRMGAQDNVSGAMAATIVVGVFGLAVTGGHMEAQVGMMATAKLGADFTPTTPVETPAASQ